MYYSEKMKCLYCQKIITDLNKFVLHLEYAHNINYNYCCPFENCSRIFHRRDCFKRHITLKHSTENQTDCNSSDHSLFQNITVFDNFGNNCATDVLPKKEHDNCTFDHKVKEFSDLLKKCILEFIGKLHTDMFIPRILIQKIIDYVKSFLNGGFFAIFKDILLSTHLNKDKDKCSDIVLNLIDMVQISLTFVYSDYKRMKFLEKSDLYIPPLTKYWFFVR